MASASKTVTRKSKGKLVPPAPPAGKNGRLSKQPEAEVKVDVNPDAENEAAYEAKKSFGNAPPQKRGSDDDFDFGDLDDDLKAYVGGDQTEEKGGVPNQWAALMEETQAELIEEDEYEEEGEEGEEESPESEDQDESEKSDIPWIFDPKDDDMPRIIDLEVYPDRKFYLDKDSFLNLEDPRLSDALIPKEEKVEKTYIGLKAVKHDYKKLCEELGVKPNKKFLNNMTSEVLDMTDYGLNDKDIVAMCHSLCNNTYIKKLSLRGSACGLQGGLAIAEMIENNYTITDLDITSTEILPAFEAICEALAMNIVIQVLNVSINELGDKEMAWLSNFLLESGTIRELNLSRNHIGDLGAFNLAKGLVDNISLQKLDLCWNRLRGTKKGFPLYDACAKHSELKYLDIWGNSIGDLGIRGITRVLSLNEKLEFMNIAYNCLGDKACAPIGKMIGKNPALLDFIAGPNLWREKAAIKMLAPLARKVDIPMQKLDFSLGLPVTKHFLKTEKKVLRAKPGLKIIHGETYGLRRRQRPDPKQQVIRRAQIVCENFETPLEMLIDELRTEPKTMKEKEFKKFIKSCNLYKDKVMTEAFFRNFLIKKSNEIDCEAIIAAYDKEYPNPNAIRKSRAEENDGEAETNATTAAKADEIKHGHTGSKGAVKRNSEK